MLLRNLFGLFFFAIIFQVNGQNINPDFDAIFVQNELSIIELEMNELDKQALVYPDDPSLDIYFQAEMHFKNSKIDEFIPKVGVRIRGNTSRNKVKKSFKIDFKEYGGEQFYQLKKMNLKPNTNDPSMLREALSWMMYRKHNVPAARVSFVELYMNGEFMGVYQNVENIDDEFVDRRFGNEEGNLYKCTWGATLAKNSDLYNNQNIEIKTNETVNDRSKLVEFVKLLNSTPSESWETQMEAVFAVDDYLRQLAVEALIGHWDGYAFNTNNYYLYENPESGRIHYIPYDLDNTWGIDWIGFDWGTKDLLSWHSRSLSVPLTTQLLKRDRYFNIYVDYLNEVLEQWFSMENYMQLYHQVIKESVGSDEYYLLDFGFNYDDFLNSIDVAWGRHVAYSLRGYSQTRYETAREQIPVSTHVPYNNQLKTMVLYPNPANGIYIHVKGMSETLSLKVYNSRGEAIPFDLEENQTLYFPQPLSKGLYVVKHGNNTAKFSVTGL
jgi:spore coat protein H